MSELLSGPLFSLILCILAGIALRYALWFGGEASDSGDSEQLQDWEQRHRALQDALEQAQGTEAKLRRDYEQALAQYEALRGSWDDRQASWQEQEQAVIAAQRDAEELRQANGQLRQDQASAAAQLRTETARGDQLHTRLEDALAQLEQVEQLQESCRVLQQNCRQLEEQLCGAEEGRAELERALQQAQEEIARLQADTRFTTALRDEQAGMKKVLAETAEKLRSLTEQRDSFATQLQEAQQALSRHAATITQRQAEIDRLQSENSTLKQSLTTAVAAAQAEIAQLRREVEQRQSELESVQTNLAETRETYGHAQQELRIARTEKEEIIRGLHRAEDGRDALREELAQARLDFEALQERAQAFEQLKLEYTQAQGQLRDVQAQAAQVDAERDAMTASLARAEARISEVETTISNMRDSVESAAAEVHRHETATRNLRIEREEALTCLERERNEREMLQRRLEVYVETIEKLRTDSQSLESLLERQADLQSSLHQHAVRLRAVTDNTQSDAPGIISLMDARNDHVPAGGDVVAEHHDPLLGLVYIQPPQQCDDLTQISGVDAALAEKLHRLGVYTFRQVMGWDQTAVAEFSKLLNFDDRIQREEWIGQASRLHSATQSEAA